MSQAFPEQIERLQRWQAGETPGPWWLVLFPTMSCNLRCAMCWGPWPKDYNETPGERLLTLVDEAADLGVRNWIMVGGGEPMVRDELLMQICERVRGRGMTGELFSNGTLFAREHVDRLIAAEWDLLRVSLDGPTPEINDAMRFRGSFEKATRALRLFHERKQACGAKFPTVGLHTTLTCTNCDKLEDMVALSEELGCDGGITLSGLIVHNDITKNFALSAQQEAELPGHLMKAMQRAEKAQIPNNLLTFMPENRSASARSAASSRSRTKLEGIYGAPCYDPWLSVAVVGGGKVGPCCAFTPDEDDGTIRTMSLKDAWVRPYMQRLREQVISGSLPAYCRACPYNLVMRTEAIRCELAATLRQRETAAATAARLARATVRSLRQDGPAKTARRAIEWIQTRKS